MSKISTYPSADTPLLLSDRLIGTEAIRPVPTPTPLATKNFSLGELLQLFSSNFPAATLQAVLNAGNTATQNITLVGTIDTTLIKPDNIEDTSGSQGITFQFLSKGTSSINWVDLPVSNLQSVLDAGNSATKNVFIVGDIDSTTITPGNVKDETGGIGALGQLLSKTSTGIRWINSPISTTPGLGDVLSVGNTATNNITLIGNIIATKAIPQNIQDEDGLIGSTGQFLSKTATGIKWITGGGGGSISLTTTGNSGPSTLVSGVLNVPEYTLSGLGGQPQLNGTGFVKVTGTVVSYDNSTYYLASNPSGFITSSALTGYVPYTGATSSVNIGTHSLTANSIIKNGGTSSQFLMADGTVTIGNGGVYSYEIHVSQTDGNDITGTGALLNPVATITKALTLITGLRRTIVIHPGNYTESPNVTFQYTVLTTYAQLGGNTLITGTISTNTGCTISGLKMTNLNITAPTGQGNVNILNCDVSGTLTKSSTGDYTLIRFTDIGTTNITSSAGLIAIFGGNPNFITVNNAGARVIVKNAVTVAPVLLAGNLTFADCIIIATTNTSNAVTTSAGTIFTIANSQIIIPTFQDVARISLSGFYSELNCVYDRPNSFLIGPSATGGSTNSIVYSQFINADKFIKEGGTNLQYLMADGSVSTGSTGTVTSVGMTVPPAFSVTPSTITSSGTFVITGAGLASQYVRGDGGLANFPTSTGGGASVSYYLNGSISQGTIGGVAYKEMNGTPIIGAGTDFSISVDGYIANFITDVGDPNKLLIPSGNWNFETYFSASSGGGSPKFYIELYKYDGTTFSLIASNSATPENITGGTAIDLYFTALAVPPTVLLATDRLAVRFYVIHSGRTITMHTENSHLSQIITTFSTGLTALNGLTSQVQYLQVGTSGSDFGISSSGDTHTFNLPTASVSNRGALSSTDWSLFNGKQDLLVSGTNIKTINGNSVLGSGNLLLGVPMTRQEFTYIGAQTFTLSGTPSDVYAVFVNGQELKSTQYSLATNVLTITNTLQIINGLPDQVSILYTPTSVGILEYYTKSQINAITIATTAPLTGGGDLSANRTLSIAQSNGSTDGYLSSADWIDFNAKQDAITLTTNNYSGVATFVGNTLNIPDYGGFIPDLTGGETFRGVNYSNNSTTEVTSGGVVMGTTASTIARSVSSTNYAFKQVRKGFYGSVVSAGRYTGTRGSALLWYIGGGFKYVCDFYISDTAYGSGCRQFYGVAGQTTDLGYSDSILVSSLVNIIGVGSDALDTNLQVFHNDATGTATKVDLGINFPANRTAGAALTTVYSIELYNGSESTEVKYCVRNKETGDVAMGILTTNLPLHTQGLNFFASRCMGAGITNTGQFDLLILGTYSI